VAAHATSLGKATLAFIKTRECEQKTEAANPRIALHTACSRCVLEYFLHKLRQQLKNQSIQVLRKPPRISAGAM
jgi:DNA-binding IclR family transcriptional regulator